MGIFNKNKWTKGTFSRSLIYRDALLVCDILGQPEMWVRLQPVKREFVSDEEIERLCGLRNFQRRADALHMLLTAKMIEADISPEELKEKCKTDSTIRSCYKLTEQGCKWYAEQHLKDYDSISKLGYFVLGIVATIILKLVF